MRTPFFTIAVLLMSAACASNTPEQSAKEQADKSQSPTSAFAETAPIRTKDGWQVFASGLVFKTIKTTEGNRPMPGDEVAVHYRIMDRSGQVQSDSRQKGNPMAFVLGMQEVVKGWEDGLAMMREGELAILKIPPHLALRISKAGMVAPKDTTFCELELRKVTPMPPLDITYHKRNEGATPQNGQVVIYRYEGRIAESGQIFETNFTQPNPSWLVMGERGRTIFGVQETLRQMTIGDSVSVEIPSRYAFGKQGYLRGVPPNTDVSFRITLEQIREAGQHQPLVVSGKESMTTDKGVLIEWVKRTQGAKPTPDSCYVRIHWTAYASEGPGILRTTAIAGMPDVLPFGEVALPQGIVDGISQMSVGEVARLRVPAGLAWGINGVPGKLPPKKDVLVDVELLEILPIEQ